MSGYNVTAGSHGTPPNGMAAFARDLLLRLTADDLARIEREREDDAQTTCVPESYMIPTRDAQIDTTIQMVTGHDAFIAALVEQVAALQQREAQHHAALAQQGRLIAKLHQELLRCTRLLTTTLDEQGKAFLAIGTLEDAVGTLQATQASAKAA